MGNDGSPLTLDRMLLRIPFRPFAVVTVSLPSVSLAICFITAFVFRFEDVNETMCEVDGIPPPELVKNFIPSISAVTGITPQSYVWRIGIALHSAPRLIVSILHYNLYLQRLTCVKESRQRLFMRLIRLNFWLSIVENSMLIGVTYVSNKDNYPVHEKIFIIFMFSTLFYMLCNIICFKMSCDTTMTKDEERSYFWKKLMFASIMTATAGLVYFYLRHRLLCEPGAFSYFSLCEYVIAYTAMGYHFTAYIEFKDMEWLVASPVEPTSTCNGSVCVSDNNNVCHTESASSSSTNLRSRKHE